MRTFYINNQALPNLLINRIFQRKKLRENVVNSGDWLSTYRSPSIVPWSPANSVTVGDQFIYRKFTGGTEQSYIIATVCEPFEVVEYE